VFHLTYPYLIWTVGFLTEQCETTGKTKPAIEIYSFEDIDFTENISSLILKRQILDKLKVNLVVFNDHIEIRCHIPIEPERSTNVILNLGLAPVGKYH